jgi:hypothetical protein
VRHDQRWYYHVDRDYTNLTQPKRSETELKRVNCDQSRSNGKLVITLSSSLGCLYVQNVVPGDGASLVALSNCGRREDRTARPTELCAGLWGPRRGRLGQGRTGQLLPARGSGGSHSNCAQGLGLGALVRGYGAQVVVALGRSTWPGGSQPRAEMALKQ